MEIINEIKVGKESIFIIEEYIENKKVELRTINIKSVTIDYQKTKKYLIYDSNHRVISDSYGFLNHSLKEVSINTKNNYFYALKYFYTFVAIIEKPIRDLDFNDFRKLNYFLKGVSSEGEELKFNLITKRSNNTINGFFSIYREFYKFLQLNDSPLFRERSLSKFIPKSRITGKNKKSQICPKYISRDEFEQIMKYINENIDDEERQLRIKCIVRLMYYAGLRVGEVLGLTLEDFELRVSSNGTEHCIVMVRNRYSDKPYQKAKTCMNITSTRDYNRNDYKKKKVGFQEAILLDLDGIDTYDLICEYIDIAHDNAIKKYGMKYEKSKADAVDNFAAGNKENHYLFLNRRGTCLSNVTWNNELRGIFEAINLPIDYGVKRNNLSHRFRHGFVMLLLYNINMHKSKVKIFTRHKNDSGLNPYNNPTSADIIAIKEDIERSELSIENSFEEH